jgi:hypothetical protein
MGDVNGQFNVDDPSYSDLLTLLFKEEKPDFVFEEEAGLGPTTAEAKAQAELGPRRSLDVDPARKERKSLGLNLDSRENFNFLCTLR